LLRVQEGDGLSNKEFLPVDENGEFDEQRWLQLAKMAEMGLSVAAIVHEVRQPLSALKMAVQIASGEKDEAEKADCLSEALKQTKRVEHLVERIRNFLRPGDQERTREDLSAVVSGVVSLLTGDPNSKSEEVVFRAPENLPDLLLEKDKIEQLFFNLIGNARDAILEQAEGRIVVIIRKSIKGHIESIVADNGQGIDPEQAARIFEPYYSSKGETKGTGLGLFIAKRIVEQHDAQIELLDREALDNLREGRLSTGFKVTFSAPDGEDTLPPKKADSPGGNRMLVVDDEKVIRTLLEKAFVKDDLQVSLAANGEDAVDLLERGAFDLTIVDKNLPGINGIEVARVARNLHPRMPIIIMTGYPSEGSAQEAAALKVFDYIVKPIDMDELKIRVREIFRMSDYPESVSLSLGSRQREPVKTAQARIEIKSSPGGQYSFSAGTKKNRVSVPKDSLDGLEVVLVDEDETVRLKLAIILERLGCKVVGFSNARQAGVHIAKLGCDVVMARSDVIRIHKEWLTPHGGRIYAPGAVAIMERGGVDKAIEAIHIGAQGTVVSPFNSDKVAFDFKRAVAKLMEERES
jgi:DNA-binding response OmpR family regulator